jgi:hypothetical protein
MSASWGLNTFGLTAADCELSALGDMYLSHVGSAAEHIMTGVDPQGFG